MKKDSRLFVASAGSVAGTAVVCKLAAEGYVNVRGFDGDEPGLTDAHEVEQFFEDNRPEYVFLAGGKAAGIRANQLQPAELMLENLLVECNVIHNAWRYGAKKLVFLASSCCYPRVCRQPMTVDCLLTGELEPTSAPYATAKIAGMMLCEAYSRQYGAKFVTAIPADVFGPGESFEAEQAHVIPALIARLYEAKLRGAAKVTVWGTGSQTRDFLFSEDLADAWVFIMEHYDGPGPINIAGYGEVSIQELVAMLKEVVGFNGGVEFDTSRPDGAPRKILDPTALRQLGWRPRIDLRPGLERTFEYYLSVRSASASAS